jgi:hypothetical protein
VAAETEGSTPLIPKPLLPGETIFLCISVLEFLDSRRENKIF